MSHVLTPSWVGAMGLLVGTIGICCAIYLSMVSPYAHSLWTRLGFLFIGTAIILLSTEPIINQHILVVTARVLAIVVLTMAQFSLLAMVVYFGPFPPRGRAMQGRLGDEAAGAGVAELRMLAKDEYPENEDDLPEDPFEHLKFWK